MARIVTNPAYTMLARFYDRLTAGAARMNRHARRKIIGRILPRLHVVCDLGCGTGTTAIELARRGLTVYAVDRSPEMCRQARQKARRARVSVHIDCADLRRFRLPELVDLVTCEFNPLNHLPGKSDLGRAFRAVARALRPGGWFYFDLNMRPTYETYYPMTRWEDHGDFCLVVRGRMDTKRARGWLDLEWFVREDSTWRRYHERIKDTWWNDAEIRAALRRTGFVRIRSWDGARVRPRSIHAKRGFDSYYLARKPAARGR